MTDVGQIILDAATRIFADSFGREELAAAAHGKWLAEQWASIEAAGLPLALADEASGGAGIEIEAALDLVELAARYVVPLPVVETMLANHLLAKSGLILCDGAASLVVPRTTDTLSLTCTGPGQWRLGGQASAVAWADHVDAIVLEAREGNRDSASHVVRIRKGSWKVEQSGAVMTGHTQSRVSFDVALGPADCAPMSEQLGGNAVLKAGAALRAIGMSGSINRILELTIGYLQTRKQFGRQLSQFQVLQHETAKVAAQGAAASGAAGIAADAFDNGLSEAQVAVAKIRAGEAAGIVAGLAHQLHGAMGVSDEYDLHYLTRQLWTWRDEFGSETYWNSRLGALALTSNDDLWTFVTAL